MRTWKLVGLAVGVAMLSGCAEMWCAPSCHSHTRNSSSLVEFLYPDDKNVPPNNAVPQLPIPLKVGLAFLPSTNAAEGMSLSAAQQEELLQKVQRRFQNRKFIANIVVIPDYYLTGHRGFEGLQGVQRLYGVDLMALVSYDQVTHEDDTKLSLGYLTIVGAYVLPGTRHDVSTLVDLAVVDPVTRSLVLRAGGTDTRQGTTTLIDSGRKTREAAGDGYTAATEQMIEHFDTALSQFEADVRSGKAAVRVVSKNDPGHLRGGGGALGFYSVLALFGCVLYRGSRRLEESV